MTPPADFFAAARTIFESLLAELGGESTSRMTHTELEALIDTKGREAMRLAMQGHLDRRAAEEVKHEAVTGSDGRVRNHRRDSSCTMLALFGEVKPTRVAYSRPGAPALFPLDGDLNLAPDYYSLSVRARVAELALTASFEHTVELMRNQSGLLVPKRQVEELTIRAAVDFDAFYAQRKARTPESGDDLLILTFDGKGIVMRKDALREATRKAAENEAHKLDSRLSPGEKANRKRMAEVASVYSIALWKRTPEQVMGEADGTLDARPRPKAKRVWASVDKNQAAVVEEVFAEAESRDPRHERRWVVLVDGNGPQIKQAKAAARRHKVEVTLVLDLIHVIEYLWKAAWDFFETGDEAAEAWVRERVGLILRGKSSDVAAGMRRSATMRGFDPDRRKKVDKSCDYLIGHRAMMRYDRYLADGLPIATGVIEGACRHLVQDRMDVTGARWGLEGAEAVLRLRSLQASGDLKEYWSFHQRAEFHRNHLMRYAGDMFEGHPLLAAA